MVDTLCTRNGKGTIKYVGEFDQQILIYWGTTTPPPPPTCTSVCVVVELPQCSGRWVGSCRSSHRVSVSVVVVVVGWVTVGNWKQMLFRNDERHSETIDGHGWWHNEEEDEEDEEEVDDGPLAEDEDVSRSVCFAKRI